MPVTSSKIGVTGMVEMTDMPVIHLMTRMPVLSGMTRMSGTHELCEKREITGMPGMTVLSELMPCQ